MEHVEAVFVSTEAMLEAVPESEEEVLARGSRERGLILHKLMEEVLIGETVEDAQVLQKRAAELMSQLGIDNAPDPQDGPCSTEIAKTIERTLQLSAIAEIRPRLLPEFCIYTGTVENAVASLTAGVADAVAVDETGHIDTVVDWKSDVAPGQRIVELYRNQLRDYLRATTARRGLLVFLSSGRIEEIAMS